MVAIDAIVAGETLAFGIIVGAVAFKVSLLAKDKELGIEVIVCAIEDAKLGTEVEVDSEPELGAKVGLVLLLEEAVPLSVVVAVTLRVAVVLALSTSVPLGVGPLVMDNAIALGIIVGDDTTIGNMIPSLVVLKVGSSLPTTMNLVSFCDNSTTVTVTAVTIGSTAISLLISQRQQNEARPPSISPSYRGFLGLASY